MSSRRETSTRKGPLPMAAMPSHADKPCIQSAEDKWLLGRIASVLAMIILGSWVLVGLVS